MKVKANRDLRLQLFLLGENDMLPSNYDGDGLLHEFEQPNLIPQKPRYVIKQVIASVNA